jgi:hypothetical protein
MRDVDERAGAPTSVPALEVDLTYGGMYAGTSFDFSAAMAAHFNDAAGRAAGVLPGEFRPFQPGEHFSIACPTRPVPRAQFIAAYNRLRAVIDEATEIHLGDHAHLFSAGLDDRETLRGTPTYIPKSLLPADFFGRPHSVELFQDDQRIFGPVERFFHTSTSGAVFSHIEDAPGRLVLEVRGNLDVLARRGEVVWFTDPVFGEPSAVTQLNADGSAVPLEWHMLGLDRVGDVLLFNEWVAVGVRPRDAVVTIEVQFPNRGRGLAAGLYSGHTRDTAFRPDAEVL